MSGSVTYSILSAGGVVDGHDPDSVIAEFCKIFNISADKAAVYVEKQKLIKKDLTQAEAIAYQEQFTKMGVPVTLKKHKVEKPDEFAGLSLTPAHDAEDDPDEVSSTTAAVAGATAASASSSAAAPKGFCCPKCEKEQKRSDTCVSCGIIFEKIQCSSSSR